MENRVKIKMKVDVYLWIGLEEKMPYISLKKGKEYTVRNIRSPGIYIVADENSISQLVLVPFEGRVIVGT